jgi:pyridoxamine 5'-phosphate oxidase
MEFWRNRPFRLHDRLVFARETPGAAWAKDRLYP